MLFTEHLTLFWMYAKLSLIGWGGDLGITALPTQDQGDSSDHWIDSYSEPLLPQWWHRYGLCIITFIQAEPESNYVKNTYIYFSIPRYFLPSCIPCIMAKCLHHPLTSLYILTLSGYSVVPICSGTALSSSHHMTHKQLQDPLVPAAVNEILWGRSRSGTELLCVYL